MNRAFQIEKLLRRVLISLISMLFSGSVFAHKGEKHEEKKAHVKPSRTEIVLFENLNNEYVKNVKPIFLKSCLDCHGSPVSLRWYYAFPVAKQLMNYDMKESKAHLDMTKDFPFGGHGSPLEDLEAIASVLENESMPPLRYRMMHWSSRITSQERKTIASWIQNGKEALKKISNQNNKEK